MKTSTFLSKVLKSFNNGKSYSSTGVTGPVDKFHGGWTFKLEPKNPNLIEALKKFENKIGVKMANKAKVAIARSLGHTNIEGFQKNGYSKVAAVVKAAIKRERANGN